MDEAVYSWCVLLALTAVQKFTQPFPRAVDAREVAPAPSWIAEVDSTIMLCADQPGISWLAIAADHADALTAGRVLGLTTE